MKSQVIDDAAHVTLDGDDLPPTDKDQKPDPEPEMQGDPEPEPEPEQESKPNGQDFAVEGVVNS